MVITGTLLLCDAWFDVALDYGSSNFTTSILSAVLVEIPLAFLLFASTRQAGPGHLRDHHATVEGVAAGAAALAGATVRRRTAGVPLRPG